MNQAKKWNCNIMAILEMSTQMQEILAKLHDEISARGLKYYIETYGCQMNMNDSEKIAGILCEAGFTAASDRDEADFLLFNTCCVRDHAEKRVFGNIGALKQRKDEDPGVLIGVCGCMMQQENVAKKLYKRYPFVDLIFGTHQMQELPAMLSSILNGERVLNNNKTGDDVIEGLPTLRATEVSTSVSIMFGCNNFCSYCIVPYVRGRERSRESERILTEIKELVQNGYSEITLLGQNVNSYGKDIQTSFPELLHAVSEIDGLRRIRFMTSHPKDLSPALMRAMAELEKVCPHIHLPVQSGSNRILQLMNRGYTREQYLDLVRSLREQVSDVEITTDIIVGFPGETDEDFKQTLDLVKQVEFAAAFTFMYSPRPGTRAAEMADQLPQSEKKKRLLTLNELQAEQTKKNNQKYVGYRGEVLVEGCDLRGAKALAYGKYENFKMVYFPGDADMIGHYLRVEVEKTQKNSLIGKIINN